LIYRKRESGYFSKKSFGKKFWGGLQKYRFTESEGGYPQKKKFAEEKMRRPESEWNRACFFLLIINVADLAIYCAKDFHSLEKYFQGRSTAPVIDSVVTEYLAVTRWELDFLLGDLAPTEHIRVSNGSPLMVQSRGSSEAMEPRHALNSQ
jgi:hypothetical protein